ncbi:hypothetical protein D9615_005372 [Tricholomella constricta]|uniref:CxC2-like cysteine cluster KDZ transposase-associated domain-containing protein n=1 Tax=Tricholomella constricta TaxID=117010 RepID=A0A8H5HEH7_9AGAR|nr:hypothetical protein D9615_005372 [Tricholomella constricta]
MSTKRRSKKKNQNLQLRAHALPEFNRAETPPPRPIHIPLTRYHTLPSGNLGSSTSYHPVCVSPSKQPGPPLSSVVEPSISDYEPTNVSAPSDAQWVDPAYLDHLEDTVVAPRARRRAIPDRDMFVAEDIRWDGRGEHLDQLCPECGAGEPKYRCEDCEGGQLLCHECTLAAHRRNSLHRLKAWNGSFFKKTSLKSLGLRIQLGHRVGKACSNPKPAFANDFVVVHVNGIHEVALDFCNCQTAQLHFIYLTRSMPRESHFPSDFIGYDYDFDPDVFADKATSNRMGASVVQCKVPPKLNISFGNLDAPDNLADPDGDTDKSDDSHYDNFQDLAAEIHVWRDAYGGSQGWASALDASWDRAWKTDTTDKWLTAVWEHANEGRDLLARMRLMEGQLPLEMWKLREMWRQEVELVEHKSHY